MKSVIETAGHGTYGPFRDEETASAWACTHVRDSSWRLVKLREPGGLGAGNTPPPQRSPACGGGSERSKQEGELRGAGT